MFAAVGRFLANVAGPAGTLLVLDDLQWAGSDALDLLTTLVRSSASTPLRVLGAYRTTEVRPPDPLGQTLADLAAAGLVAQQRLGPLAQEEASTLLQRILAGEQDPGQERREQVLARTGGVPFFLVSCAEALRHGTLASEEEAVPWTVAQSIRQRVAALAVAAQEVLGVAAVIGRQMKRSVLVATLTSSGQDTGALVGALEEVGQAHLLVETGEDHYQFPHDLIREVVLSDLSALRRCHWHAQIAAALEHAPGEPQVEQLAYHYRQTDDHEKAILYLEQAGDRAASLYANAEAQGAYRALLARLQALGHPLDEARVAEKLAKILRIQAHYEQALEVFQQAADAYERGGGQEGYWRVVTEIGWSYHRRGRHAEGLTLLRPLVVAAEQSAPPRQLVAVLTLLAAHERNTGQHRAALVTAARAVELARTVGEAIPPVGPPPAVAYGRALLDEGRTEEAQRVMEEVLPLAEQGWDLTGLATVLQIIAACYLLRGEFGQSRIYRERAVELAERVGDVGHTLFYLSTRGRLHFLRGDWRAARADAEQAVGLYRQLGTSGAPPQPLLLLGEVCLAEGQWDEARSLLTEGVGCAERMGEPERLVLAQVVFAEWEVLEGRPQNAWARLQPLLDPPDREEVFLIPLWTVLAWAALDLGDEAQAEDLLQQALQYARTHQLRFSLVDPLRILARLCLRQERWEEAQAALEEALILCRAMPYPYAEAKALYVSGLVHQAKGEPEQAREQMEAALAICARLGERLYAKRIEAAQALLKR
jgi:tetratricopeptide (TPR) repeat protein